VGRDGAYLDLLERARLSVPPDSRLALRLAAVRSVRYGQTGQVEEAVAEALTVRAVQERTGLADEWAAVVPINLPRAYQLLKDYEAVEREAIAALAAPGLTEPVKLVLVPGTRALASFEAGHLARAADAARGAEGQARRLGFDQHFFAVEYLRTKVGLALERRDLDAAEQLTEQALSISEGRRPFYEFLTLLDRAGIWAARGQVGDVLATVEAARPVLAGTGSVLLARADELEAVLRLSLGDPRSAAELARGLPAARRELLQARIALAGGDHQAAQELLRAPARTEPGELTPRRALVRQLLLAAAAIGRGDSPNRRRHPGRRAGRGPPRGLPWHRHHDLVPGQRLPDRARDPDAARPVHRAADRRRASGPRRAAGRLPARPRTGRAAHRHPAAHRLLPTSNPLQIAATLYISRITVKTHLRSIYQKLGVASRSEAVERAVDLHLL
jgi:LuxR family transcriptional regulator, maltose regulon positive regulatory protein